MSSHFLENLARSPLAGEVSNSVESGSERDSKLSLVSWKHLNSGSAVSVTVIANDNGISLFPFKGESVLVLQVNPLLPFSIGQLREVTKSELDRSVLGLELLHTGPRIEPHVMISDRRVNDVSIHVGSIFKGRDVELGHHVPLFAEGVSSPRDLETALFSGGLSLFRALGHERGLPVVVDGRLVFASVSLLVRQISPVAEASVLQFLSQFGSHEFISNTDSVRKVGGPSHSAEGVLAREGDLSAGFANVGHFVMVVKVGSLRGSGLIEVGIQFAARIGAAFILHVIFEAYLNIFF